VVRLYLGPQLVLVVLRERKKEHLLLLRLLRKVQLDGQSIKECDKPKSWSAVLEQVEKLLSEPYRELVWKSLSFGM
jgi:hypothetical protein